MRYLLLLISLGCFSLQSFAQKQIKVRGVVKSDEGKSLSGASVLLYYPGTKDSLKTVTNEKGVFTFSAVNPAKVAVLTSYVGYKSFISNYDYSGQTGDQAIWDIVMSPGDNTLEAVTLEAAKIQIKEDTVSYKIDSTMYRANDNVETLLKKLPGVEVDKSGNVTAQGKQVSKVKVNGKEFFGGDVLTATRELNADMVDRIQVIDDYGDQAAFNGIKDGEASKTLNIDLKKDKNKGYFGNVTAGAGTEERYTTGISVNRFNNSQQISLLANANNINASTFNFGSMGGSAMGNMAGGMIRSMGIGRGGAGMGAALGSSGNGDGIGTSQSVGLNFRDDWTPKLSGYGSYSFSRKNTNTIKNSSQQNTFDNSIYVQNSDDDNLTTNHRFSFNLEYKMDSFNYFKFTPSVSVRNTDANYLSDFLLSTDGIKENEGTTKDFSNSSSPNLSGNLLFNHRFKKKGRTLSLNLTKGTSSGESVDDYVNLSKVYPTGGGSVQRNTYQYVTQDNENRNTNLRASYVEPINKKQNIELNYSYSRQVTGNDRENYSVEPASQAKTYVDSLSNIFDNTYITNRLGVNFRTNEKKYNYSVGLAVQPATIKSNSITGKYEYKQDIVNYYPVVRFAYNFSRSRSFSVNYSGSTSQPSYTQLQPVADYSNPQYITVGNPNLRPEFTNNLSLRYNNFDFITGDVFFGNISASFTNDKIVNNTSFIGPGVQQTKYLNSDGFYTVTGFYNISKPLQNRKYVFNVGGNVTYNNNISFFKNEKNRGKNWLLGQRVSMDYKLKKWLESTLALNYSFNTTSSVLQENNSNTKAFTISHNSRIFLPKNWIFNYDMDKSINSGYADNVNSNPFIINASIEKQLFKKKNVSLKLQAVDMLNENININRNVTGSYISDTRTNRLGRYFMATAILRLNKFQGQAPQQNRIIMGGAPTPGHGF
jgi:hypothetical protein